MPYFHMWSRDLLAGVFPRTAWMAWVVPKRRHLLWRIMNKVFSESSTQWPSREGVWLLSLEPSIREIHPGSFCSSYLAPGVYAE